MNRKTEIALQRKALARCATEGRQREKTGEMGFFEATSACLSEVQIRKPNLPLTEQPTTAPVMPGATNSPPLVDGQSSQTLPSL